jgi:hypothetical protein
MEANMALSELSPRNNPTISSELERLVDLSRHLERLDNMTQEIGCRLTGPYPVRGEDANRDEGPLGDMQRLQLLVDRLIDRAVRIQDAIDHVRTGLYGYEGETAIKVSGTSVGRG